MVAINLSITYWMNKHFLDTSGWHMICRRAKTTKYSIEIGQIYFIIPTSFLFLKANAWEVLQSHITISLPLLNFYLPYSICFFFLPQKIPKDQTEPSWALLLFKNNLEPHKPWKVIVALQEEANDPELCNGF